MTEDPKQFLIKRKRQRAGHRGHATQLIKRADQLLKEDQPSTRDLRQVRAALDNMETLLTDLDDEILGLIADEDDFVKDLEDGQDLRHRLRDLSEQATATLEDIEADRNRQAQIAAVQARASAPVTAQPKSVEPVAKLPQIPIGTFNGDPLEWQQFFDSFNTTIGKNSNLSGSQKMKYLKEHLKGEAATFLQGYPDTDAMYPEALAALIERYGDVEVVKFAHLQALLNMPVSSADLPKLRKTVDTFERHIRSLDALGLNQDTFGVVFTPIILSKLPCEVQLELHRKNGTSRWEFSTLRTLLKTELAARDRSARFQVGNPSISGESSGWGGQKKKFGFKTTDAALVQSGKTKKSTPKCIFCGSNHYSDRCLKFKTVSQRKTELMKQRRCFICLSNEHLARDCYNKRQCCFCDSEQHHRSLCLKRDQRSSPVGQSKEASNLNCEAPEFVPSTTKDTALVTNHSDHPVLLQLASAYISGSRGKRLARFLLDPGSSRSFIRTPICDEVGAKYVGSRVAAMSGFGSRRRKSVAYDVVNVEVHLQQGEVETLSLGAVDPICCPVEKPPVRNVPQIISLPLAEPLVTSSQLVDIDILLGADCYYALVESAPTPLGRDGLVMLASKFGYIITGPIVNDEFPNEDVLTFTGTDPRLEDLMNLEKFWSLEDLGVRSAATEQQTDEAVLAKFMETVERVDGRYQVKWPLKSDTSQLQDNYGLALGRLRSLLRRLRQNPQTLDKYDKVIQDQFEKGVIEVAPTVPDGEQCYYIPHHGVETPQKTTTKLRVVYDASSKASKGAQSLNECLYRGPVLMTDMGGLLLRFRSHPIAFVSDIEKAYLQVGLHEPDRDLVRFLWVKDVTKPPEKDNLMVFRFCRVPFGVITSESLLDMTVYIICAAHQHQTAKSIADNHFVDDVVDGTETVEQAITYYSEAKSMFADAQMNLREWFSNSAAFAAKIAPRDVGKGGETKVLGIVWNTEEDTLALRAPKGSSTRVSKREILRKLASVFDPLGFASPVLMHSKVLLQDLWKEKLGWDDPLPEELANTWHVCCQELEGIAAIQLPRFAFNSYDQTSQFEIHTFCDASSKAYGAVCYIRAASTERVTVNFLMSKCRVTPVKTVTIPKLELLATVVGAKITTYVQQQLNLTAPRLFLWTDSQCVLWWLRSAAVSTVYVRNRINQVREVPDLTVSYVPSAENPADILSRGSTVKGLTTGSSWFHGPEWLRQVGPESWPKQPDTLKHPPELTEKVTVLAHGDAILPTDSQLLPLNRYSALNKAVRVLAYVLRFINNLQKRLVLRRNGLDPEDEDDVALHAAELTTARKRLICNEQKRFFGSQLERCSNSVRNRLSPFIDEEGTVRCAGRLHHSALDENAKFPVLLPAKSPLTKLVIMDAHQRCAHGGAGHTLSTLRQQYWIPRGRRSVKYLVHNCKICQRVAGGPYRVPPPPPLPAERVTRCKPFETVGLDYLGPLYVKTGNGNGEQRKVWVCLFACAVIRAVHLEIVESMNAESFMLALRTFIALRGKPRLIISDNAKTFHLATGALSRIWQEVESNKDVHGFCASNGIEWRFIPELAPWMGGMYERLVGVVKKSLKRCVRGKKLTRVQLGTVLAEVSHVVNTRPLTIVQEELEFCLTPYHLLHGTEPDLLPSNDETDDFIPQPNSSDELILRWKQLSAILNTYWDVWQREYLVSLREQPFSWKQRATQGHGPNVGDVVLIGDKLPRQHWKMGRVVELEISRDGQCRAVKVQLPSGKKLRRPVKLLYPLESSVDADVGGIPANPAH